jgi:hypothetical protein
MRAASRAAGRRARRNTGQTTGDRASMRPVRAFTSSRRPGRVPSDRRWPYRLRFVGVGLALRAPTHLQVLGFARVTLVPVSGSASPRRDRRAAPGDPRLSRLGTPAIPCVSELASSEVPGCGHVSCRSARGSVPASACSLACGRGSFAGQRARLRCLGPKTSWRPACQPLATAQSRRVTFHPYKGEEPRRSVLLYAGEKPGSPSGVVTSEVCQECPQARIPFRSGRDAKSRNWVERSTAWRALVKASASDDRVRYIDSGNHDTGRVRPGARDEPQDPAGVAAFKDRAGCGQGDPVGRPRSRNCGSRSQTMANVRGADQGPRYRPPIRIAPGEARSGPGLRCRPV